MNAYLPHSSEECSRILIVNNIPSQVQRQGCLICCCGARSWTVIISVIEIVFSIFGIVEAFTVSEEVPLHSLDSPLNPSKQSYWERRSLSEWDDYEKYFRYAWNPNVQVFEGAVALLLGCVLFAGAHYGKPVLLLVWMVVCGLHVAVLSLLLLCLFFLLILSKGHILVILIFVCSVVVFLIPIFCLSIVSIHRKEIIDAYHLEIHRNQNEVQPIVQFYAMQPSPSQQKHF